MPAVHNEEVDDGAGVLLYMADSLHALRLLILTSSRRLKLPREDSPPPLPQRAPRPGDKPTTRRLADKRVPSQTPYLVAADLEQ